MKEFHLADVIYDYVIKSKNIYSSISFLQNGKFDFTINQSIKRIRISCSHEQHLHLKGIYFYKDSNLINVDSNIDKIHYGKLYNKDVDISFNKIINPYMLYTTRDKSQNFLEIEFKNEFVVDNLVIHTYNENRVFALRANALVVDIYNKDDSICHYSYQEEMRKFSSIVCNKLFMSTYIPPFTYDQVIRIAFIIVSAINRSFYEFRELFMHLEKNNIKSSFILKYVNSIILPSDKLSYTVSYGMVKTFSLWTETEKYNYLKASSFVLKELAHSFPCSFFAFGTLLGFIRENSVFIPHDYDIDLMVIGEFDKYNSVDELRLSIIYALKQIPGIQIVSVLPVHLYATYQDSHKIDIFYSLANSSNIVDLNPMRSGKCFIKVDELVPTLGMEVMGFDCLIPKNPFAYLKSVYGSNWRVAFDRFMRMYDIDDVEMNDVLSSYRQLNSLLCYNKPALLLQNNG